MSITLNTTLYLSSCNFLLILVTAGCSTAFVDFEFYLRQPDTDILFKRFTADVSWLPVRKYTYPGSCEVNWLRLLEIRLSPNRKLVYQITTIKLHFGNWVSCHSSIRYERLSEWILQAVQKMKLGRLSVNSAAFLQRFGLRYMWVVY
jgi:hypothetical protein